MKEEEEKINESIRIKTDTVGLSSAGLLGFVLPGEWVSRHKFFKKKTEQVKKHVWDWTIVPTRLSMDSSDPKIIKKEKSKGFDYLLNTIFVAYSGILTPYI